MTTAEQTRSLRNDDFAAGLARKEGKGTGDPPPPPCLPPISRRRILVRPAALLSRPEDPQNIIQQ
ncbi:hypothetical protein EJB05_31300, partial [Eragrostis curvula]